VRGDTRAACRRGARLSAETIECRRIGNGMRREWLRLGAGGSFAPREMGTLVARGTLSAFARDSTSEPAE
jgi:hypothetical protein